MIQRLLFIILLAFGTLATNAFARRQMKFEELSGICNAAWNKAEFVIQQGE